MKSQDHKTANQDKAKVKPDIRTRPQVTHPILQLQQLVGNKAVTNMIQRHDGGAYINYDFKVRGRNGAIRWLRGEGEERPV